jgi:hypothetical protein
MPDPVHRLPAAERRGAGDGLRVRDDGQPSVCRRPSRYTGRRAPWVAGMNVFPPSPQMGQKRSLLTLPDDLLGSLWSFTPDPVLARGLPRTGEHLTDLVAAFSTPPLS